VKLNQILKRKLSVEQLFWNEMNPSNAIYCKSQLNTLPEQSPIKDKEIYLKLKKKITIHFGTFYKSALIKRIILKNHKKEYQHKNVTFCHAGHVAVTLRSLIAFQSKPS
jgi:hypothetical protein